MLFVKRRIRKAFEARLKAAANILTICDEFRSKARDLNLSNHVTYLNVVQFAVIAYRDLDTVAYENFQRRHPQVHSLHLRLWAVLIHGYVDRLRHVLGKDFREAAGKLGLDDSFLQTFGEINKELTDIWNEHQQQLESIRNSVIAHRERDASVQLSVMRSVDLIRLSRLARHVSRCTESLYTAVTSGLERVVTDVHSVEASNTGMQPSAHKTRRG